MKIINDKTIIATGIEMFENKLAKENNDDQLILWISFHWNPSSKEEFFAPVTDVYFNKKECTHKIVGEEEFIKLHLRDNIYLFEDFINKHLPIEQLC